MGSWRRRALHASVRIFVLLSLALGAIRPQFSARAASIVVTNGTSTIANGDGCSLPEAIINANNGDQSGSTDCAAGTAGTSPGNLADGADTITLNTNVTLTVRSPDSIADAGLPTIWTYITIQAGSGNTISRDTGSDASASLKSTPVPTSRWMA